MRRATFAMIIAAGWLLAGTRPATGASKPQTYTLTCSKSRVYGFWGFGLVSKTYWYTANSVAELKQQLSRFPAGTRIVWHTRPDMGFVYPPEPMFSEIRRFCSEHHFDLVLERPPPTKPKMA